jgi:chromosome segregation ATPase
MARHSRLNQDIVNEACNGLAVNGTKVTIANVRSWLMSNYGFSGNNNDLCPLVANWKEQTRASIRAGKSDLDAQFANVVNSQLPADNIPSELKLEGERFIALLYNSIYDKVDSQVGGDRIEQMQLEIDRLSANQEEYYRMKAEYTGMFQAYTPLVEQLAQTNRLLDMQKVAQGEIIVRESQTLRESYEAMSQLMVELKTQLEVSKRETTVLQEQLQIVVNRAENAEQRVSELQTEVSELRVKNAQVEILEEQLENSKQTINNPQEKLGSKSTQMTSINGEVFYIDPVIAQAISTEKQRLIVELTAQSENTQTPWQVAIQGLLEYAQHHNITNELEKPRKAGHKELRSFLDWLELQQRQLEIPGLGCQG